MGLDPKEMKRLQKSAKKHMGNPAYAGMTPDQVVKAEFTYGIGKKSFGVLDDMGQFISKHRWGILPNPAYAAEKQHMREQAAGIALGKPIAGLLTPDDLGAV